MKTTCFKIVFAVFVFAFAMIIPGMSFATAVIQKMRVGQDKDTSRIIFELNTKPLFRTFTLSKPDRLVVDLSNARVNKAFKQPSFSKKLFKAIRFGQRPQHGLRIVFDLQNRVQYKVFALGAMQGFPPRLVVDLSPSSKAQPQNTNASKIAPALQVTAFKPNKAKPKVKVALPKQKQLRNIVIVIDPGHGGMDPGASGPLGVHEKNVVLAISKDLQQMLNEQKGFHAVLTRSSDRFIPLRGRLAIVRKDKGDIFVAIHADAYMNNSAEGVSVFAISQRGATSEAARWLAQKENESELGKVHLSEYKSDILRSVLIDLTQTAIISRSLEMGIDVLRELGKVAAMHHGSVEQAAFVVLKSPDIPSLLVETGFLSNPNEERRLKTPRYQRRIAEAIMRGIKDYFVRRPPVGTILASS